MQYSKANEFTARDEVALKMSDDPGGPHLRRRPTLRQTMSKAIPSVPSALPIIDALNRSNPLMLLRRRLDESAKRHEAVRPYLPPALVPHIAPGPVDDEGWTLIAANAAVAAKLRHLQPRLEEQLLKQGFQAIALRVKVRSV